MTPLTELTVNTDNARLRHALRRVIAEREIATDALRSILRNPAGASGQAEDALHRIMSLPRDEVA